jgi:hypothetical protein
VAHAIYFVWNLFSHYLSIEAISVGVLGVAGLSVLLELGLLGGAEPSLTANLAENVHGLLVGLQLRLGRAGSSGLLGVSLSFLLSAVLRKKPSQQTALRYEIANVGILEVAQLPSGLISINIQNTRPLESNLQGGRQANALQIREKKSKGPLHEIPWINKYRMRTELRFLNRLQSEY